MVDVSEIVIYGASGHARTFASMTKRGFVPQIARDVAAYIDDFAGGQNQTLDGLPILNFDEWRHRYPDNPCLMSMALPATKAKLRAKIVAAAAPFADIFKNRPNGLFERVEIGVGSFIWEFCHISTDTTIGEHTQIMPLCSIGHDVVIGDCCTICPSCVVSGHVIVEDGVFIGAGTTIVNGSDRAPLRIGRGAKIWAGSVVMRSVDAGVNVAGNPAAALKEFVQRRRILVAA